MDNTIFAKRLKEARTAAGLTQGELSKAAGVTAATISAYESADGTKGKNPSLDNALKLAQALHISLDWLCGSVVTNEKFQITDYLKMFVKLSEFCGIAVDDVDFAVADNKTIFPNINELVFEDEEDWNYYSQMQDYAEYEHRCFTYYIPVVYFKNNYINSFFAEWQKMYRLLKSGTIDKNLYDLWLNQQYQKIDEEQKQNEELQKRNEEYNQNLLDSKDGGEENGKHQSEEE